MLFEGPFCLVKLLLEQNVVSQGKHFRVGANQHENQDFFVIAYGCLEEGMAQFARIADQEAVLCLF